MFKLIVVRHFFELGLKFLYIFLYIFSISSGCTKINGKIRIFFREKKKK